jgi:hypothetical protein
MCDRIVEPKQAFHRTSGVAKPRQCKPYCFVCLQGWIQWFAHLFRSNSDPLCIVFRDRSQSKKILSLNLLSPVQVKMDHVAVCVGLYQGTYLSHLHATTNVHFRDYPLFRITRGTHRSCPELKVRLLCTSGLRRRPHIDP